MIVHKVALDYLLLLLIFTGVFLVIETYLAAWTIKTLDKLENSTFQLDNSLILILGRFWFLLAFIRMFMWYFLDILLLTVLILFPSWVIFEQRFKTLRGIGVLSEFKLKKLVDLAKLRPFFFIIFILFSIVLGLFFLIPTYEFDVDLIVVAIPLILLFYWLMVSEKPTSFLQEEKFTSSFMLWMIRLVGVKVFLSLTILNIAYLGLFSYPIIYQIWLLLVLFLNELINNVHFSEKITSSSKFLFKTVEFHQ